MYLRYLSLLVLIVITSIIAISGCNSPETSPAASNPQSTATSSSSPEVTPTNTLPPTYTDSLSETVIKADIIVLGTITDLKYEAADHTKGDFGSVYTIFTLAVEKTIKGDPDLKEVFIRVPGGKLGNDQQIPVPPWPYFAISNETLICLERDLQRENENIYIPPIDSTGPVGILWGRHDDVETSPALPEMLGRVMQIMKDNNIPVAMPESDYPPLPAEINLSSKLSKLTQNELDQIEEYLKNPPGRQ